MEDDVITPGLSEFEDAVQALGGTVVFISGRWTSEMARASRIALHRAHMGNEPNLVIGNKGHDDPSKPLSDSDAKKQAQDYIRAHYGLPVAMFDDRKSNLDAVASLRGDKVAADFVAVVSCIPGYSAAPTATSDPTLPAISNFFLNRLDPRAPDGSAAAAAAATAAATTSPAAAGAATTADGKEAVPKAAVTATAARTVDRGVGASTLLMAEPTAPGLLLPASGPLNVASRALFEASDAATASLGPPHLRLLSRGPGTAAAARHEAGIVRVVSWP